MRGRRSGGDDDRILAEVRRLSSGRTVYWLLVQQVADTLGLADDVVDAAIRRAAGRGAFDGTALLPCDLRSFDR